MSMSKVVATLQEYSWKVYYSCKNIGFKINVIGHERHERDWNWNIG